MLLLLCLYAAMQLAVDQLIIVVKMSFEFTIKYAQLTFTLLAHILIHAIQVCTLFKDLKNTYQYN